jgi:hypothetical protein
VARLVKMDLDNSKSALSSNRNNPSTPVLASVWEARSTAGGDGIRKRTFVSEFFSEDTAADEEREKLIKKFYR